VQKGCVSAPAGKACAREMQRDTIRGDISTQKDRMHSMTHEKTWSGANREWASGRQRWYDGVGEDALRGKDRRLRVAGKMGWGPVVA
jgi:hypothetical protein